MAKTMVSAGCSNITIGEGDERLQGNSWGSTPSTSIYTTVQPTAPREIRGGVLHCVDNRRHFPGIYVRENHLAGFWDGGEGANFESTTDSVSALPDPKGTAND